MKAVLRDNPAAQRRGLRPNPGVHSQTADRRPEPYGLDIKSILVPIDFSNASRAALRYAVTLARDYSADISLIHVVEPEAYGLLADLELSESRITFVESATARLAKIAKEEVPASIEVRPWVQIGAPYEQITSAAKILNADLIIISTHGYTGFRHAILGST
ncbi:MAG: Stress protein UspA-like protein, partial [Verrucomicrobiales bacterium]|nr:Stress protein UspA-like protein [Verrucomicrobiales bacterium]